MLISLWSTPRTGSIHYSYVLRDQYKAFLINEFFNNFHMSIYFTNRNNVQLNHTEYVPGSYYNDYFIKDGLLSGRRIYNKRTRTVSEEEEYRIDLLKKINFSAHTIVMHNHVAPISKNVYDILFRMSDRNVFTYRKDKRAQLASYAIAFSTKQFVLYKPENKITNTVPDIDRIHLENLINRIKIYDTLDKPEEIAYEEMTFSDSPNYPIKQVDDYKLLLSDHMLKMIDELVTGYENDKLNGERN